MEQVIDRTQVHGDGCIGALRHNTDVMVTGIWDTEKGGTQWLDLHMSNETAEKLIEQLQKVVDYNESVTDKDDRDRMRKEYKP